MNMYIYIHYRLYHSMHTHTHICIYMYIDRQTFIKLHYESSKLSISYGEFSSSSRSCIIVLPSLKEKPLAIKRKISRIRLGWRACSSSIELADSQYIQIRCHSLQILLILFGSTNIKTCQICIYICICMYVYIYICICICIYMYI